VVRSATPSLAVLPAVRNQLRQLDSSLSLFRPRTMSEVIYESMQDVSIQAWLLGSFAALAVLLAAVGLYSVLAYLVNQSTREIGIRMALGAQQRHVLRMVMGHAAALTVTGTVAGVLGALLLTRSIESLLYGVHGRDPLTFSAVVAVLAGVSLVASYVPARRAMSVDPMVALRYE
jgi:putative ABC transport system permease protein